MFTPLSDEQKAHWGYLRNLHHTGNIAALSAELGRQRLSELNRISDQIRCNDEFNQASETAHALGMFELTRWQAREWQRVAEAQPWLLRINELEPFALKVLEWPSEGGS